MFKNLNVDLNIVKPKLGVKYHIDYPSEDIAIFHLHLDEGYFFFNYSSHLTALHNCKAVDWVGVFT